MTARILEVTAAEYHKRPGLSSSIASTLISRSPRHARAEHPMFGEAGPDDPTKEMDRGAVVHELVLGKGKGFAVCDFDDWRTKAAKEARDIARAQGVVPILTEKLIAAQKIAEHVTHGLTERGIVLDGESELAVEWHEDAPSGPVLCRGMMDHVWVARGLILDLKIVASAAPSSVERASENLGYAIQACAYRRALEQLNPLLAGRVDFLFAFCEAEAPYAINICRPDGLMRELGERRWLRAVHAWGSCLETNEWPAYGNDINQLSAPAWALARDLESAA